MTQRPNSSITNPQELQQLACERLAFWQAQRAQIDIDRRRLRYVPPVGLLAGAGVQALVGDVRWAGACALLAITCWLMGLYMTTVRRQEYDEHIGQAKRDL